NRHSSQNLAESHTNRAISSNSRIKLGRENRIATLRQHHTRIFLALEAPFRHARRSAYYARTRVSLCAVVVARLPPADSHQKKKAGGTLLTSGGNRNPLG